MTDSDNAEKNDPTEEKASFASICYSIFAFFFVLSHFAVSEDMGFPSKTPYLQMYTFSLATYLAATLSVCIGLSKKDGAASATIDFFVLMVVLFILIFLGAWLASSAQLALMNSQ